MTKDFTGFESLITVTPDCGDDYLFELFYNPPNTSTLSPVLPGELSFADQVLSLQKCHPQGAASADAECSLEPRRKEFDLLIRISLLDDNYANPATRTFKEFGFKAIITNVCFDDALSFTYEESIINYVLSTSAPIVPYQPVLASTYPLCRSQCNLFEVGQAGYPVAVVYSFDQASLKIEFRTSDRSLDGTEILFELRCSSLFNTDPSGSVIDEFKLVFRDECFDADITPAVRADYDVALYSTSFQSFTLASVDLVGCNPIVYTILPADPSNTDLPDFTITPAKEIRVNPMSTDDIGDHDLIIRACIPIDGATPTQICEDSNPFTVTVWDTCTIGQINVGTIGRSMTAAISQTDTLDLLTEATGYPYTATVNPCGTIEYSILSASQDSETDFESPVDYVTLSGDSLILAPTSATPVGPKLLKLVGRFVNYQNITNEMLFLVVVEECVATIDATGLEINDMTRVWYQAPTVQDISAVISAITVTGSCGYNLTIVPKRKIGTDVYTDLPPEVKYNAGT